MTHDDGSDNVLLICKVAIRSVAQAFLRFSAFEKKFCAIKIERSLAWRHSLRGESAPLMWLLTIDIRHASMRKDATIIINLREFSQDRPICVNTPRKGLSETSLYVLIKANKAQHRSRSDSLTLCHLQLGFFLCKSTEQSTDLNKTKAFDSAMKRTTRNWILWTFKLRLQRMKSAFRAVSWLICRLAVALSPQGLCPFDVSMQAAGSLANWKWIKFAHIKRRLTHIGPSLWLMKVSLNKCWIKPDLNGEHNETISNESLSFGVVCITFRQLWEFLCENETK